MSDILQEIEAAQAMCAHGVSGYGHELYNAANDRLSDCHGVLGACRKEIKRLREENALLDEELEEDVGVMKILRRRAEELEARLRAVLQYLLTTNPWRSSWPKYRDGGIGAAGFERCKRCGGDQRAYDEQEGWHLCDCNNGWQEVSDE